MYCKQCGNEISDDSLFCSNCGIKIDKIDKKIEKIVSEEVLETVEKIPEKIFCWNCKEEIDKRMEICIKCGARVNVINLKNPGIAAVLSFIVPGLGYVYNGQITIGVIFPIIEISLLIIATYMIRTGSITDGFLLFILIIAIWIYGVYVSYNTAEKINYEMFKPIIR